MSVSSSFFHSFTCHSVTIFHPASFCRLSESCCAPPHDFTLAHQFGVELGPVKGEVDVEVNTVERALRSIHAFKVLFQVLAAEVGGQRDNFLDPYTRSSLATS